MRSRGLLSSVLSLACLSLALAQCSASRPHHASRALDEGAPREAILVLAPHPDDEVLTAAGVLSRAVRAGQRAVVAVMTNGDYTCERNGYVREGETVRAVGSLGVPEGDVYFLGYPDGHLARLGAPPLEPLERRDARGGCERAAHTYANRGHGAREVHRLRSENPAEYTAQNAVNDLAWLLAQVRPREVYVTHGIDDHPDHAMTYTLLRRAIDEGALGATVRVHRALVHAGPCWPNGRAAQRPCPAVELRPDEAMPALPDPLERYTPNERIALPREMRASDPREHAKARAIALYPSQTGPEPHRDWLSSFVRSDEAFFLETLVREGSRWVRQGGSPSHAVYRLELDRPAGRVRVLRGDATTVRALRLAHDALDEGRTPTLEHRAYTYEGDGPVTEITVTVDGVFLGVAVDANATP